MAEPIDTSSLEKLQRLVVVAGSLLAIIMFTGAAVRLTESGLGCEDWPTCSENRLVPEWSYHGAIEFGNRLISFAVAAAVGLVVVAARRIPGRSDLQRWAWSLVAIVAVQVVLGGITVLVDLHPAFVGVHFLLSILSIWQVTMLWHRTVAPASRRMRRGSTAIANRAKLLVGLGVVVLILGTLVTGTGPHGGDSEAQRLALNLQTVARLHAASVWILLVLTLEFVLRSRREHLPLRPLQRTLGVIVVQGAIGYLQYATGVPPLLVELHVIGSVAVWFALVRQHLSLSEPAPNDWFQYAPSPQANMGQAHV